MKITAAAIVTLLFARSANADGLHLDVDGDACDLAPLEAELPRLVAATQDPTTVRIALSEDANRITARVSFPHGSRSVAASTCGELIDSLGLVIAMALSSSEAAPVAEAAPVQSTPHVDKNAVVSRVVVEPRRSTSLAVYLGGGSSVSKSGARGTLVLGTRVQRRAFSLGLQLRADAPEEQLVADVAGVRIVRTELSLSPCIHRGSLAGCFAAGIGAIRGEGIGLRAPRTAIASVATTALRLTWERRLRGPVSIRAALEAHVLLTAAQFEIDYMPVWTSERFEGSAGLGLIARFL